MGNGDKSKTKVAGEPSWSSARPASPGYSNNSARARNLPRSELAGVIFSCKNRTISECLKHRIFGLPQRHFSYVKKIEPGLPLFLFNCTERMMHGIYEATSTGRLNIDPHRWIDAEARVDGANGSPFPAQVRINIKMYCQPLPENIFELAIKENYYSENKKLFYFELDHAQVKCLMSMFTPTPVHGSLSDKSETVLESCTSWNRPWSGSATSSQQNLGSGNSKRGGNGNCASTMDAAVTTSTFGGNRYASLSCDVEEGGSSGLSSTAGETTNDSDDDGDNEGNSDDETEVASDWEDLCRDANSDSPSGSEPVCERDNQRSLESLGRVEKFNSQTDMITDKPEVTATDDNDISSMSCSCSSDDVVSAERSAILLPAKNGVKNSSNSEEAELIKVMKELKELKDKQIEAERELDLLKKNSGCKINTLEEQVKELEIKLGSSMISSEEYLNESLCGSLFPSDKLIYLVGGHNGKSWSNELDSYSTSLDILTHHSPMRSTRPYAASVAWHGCIYSLGGHKVDLCYSTVECYDSRNNKWTYFPSLKRGKGSLSGATLNGEIYAIGGGNGKEAFSDVEVLDIHNGKWVNSRPMLQKRFGLSAVEHNGALYAVGGFDGKNYLKSAEKYDPREASSWTQLPNMYSRRGCLSLAVFNDKIYALGGYDGEKMVASIEVFDPRRNSWLIDKPMNINRGYAGSAAVGGFLFVIGGIGQNCEPVDSVECYKEGVGWMNTSLQAIGKRSFFSAIVL